MSEHMQGASERFTRDHHNWTEHGVHSHPRLDEVRPLRDVAHAAWHLLDEGGEHPEDTGLRVVSARDWERLSSALDIAGWTPDPTENARHTQGTTDPEDELP